jgi:hypothetical protein
MVQKVESFFILADNLLYRVELFIFYISLAKYITYLGGREKQY